MILLMICREEKIHTSEIFGLEESQTKEEQDSHLKERIWISILLVYSNKIFILLSLARSMFRFKHRINRGTSGFRR